MKYSLFVLFAVPLLFSCNQDPAKMREARKAHMDSLRNELLAADMAFSEFCVQKGENAAFLEYAGEHATLLRPFSMPVTGKDTMTRLFNAHPDSDYKVSWKPMRADVAHSGELGFTYGTFLLEMKDGKKEEGTYCTVWKRDKDQKWKFVLDTGNEGLAPAEKKEDKAVDAELKKESKNAKEKKK